MNILLRLNNAYRTGGIIEIFRKVFFKIIYKVNNFFTKEYVFLHTPKYALNKVKRESEIIVSLTSFPPRFSGLALCLKSLCLQSIKPDKILVYFGSDVEESNLPDNIKKFVNYGVEFVFVNNEDLKPHKKYFYSLKDYPNSVIVTADDDVLYPKNWLKNFLKVHKKYPKCVCAWRLHKMKSNATGLLKYNYWIDQYRKTKTPSFSLFPTGVGGVLYPPNCFDKRVFDKETLIKICLNADDVWLKVMYTLHGTKTVWVPNMEVELASVEKEQKISLSIDNVGVCKNDYYINEVLKKFNVDFKIFFKD